MTCLFLLTVCLLGLQEPNVDASMSVDYIVLDVLAEDENGVPVTDLKPGDIRVRENRKKIDVEYFGTLDFRPEAEGGRPIDLNADPILQTLIMVLDLGTDHPNNRRLALEQIRRFLKQIEPENNVQMFLYSMNLGVISRQFTNDPHILLEDLDIYEGRIETENPNEQSWQRMSLLEKDLAECLSRERVGPDLQNRRGAGMIATCLNDVHAVHLGREERRIKAQLAILNRFMRFLAGIDGLKSMYFISPGVPREIGPASARMVHSYRTQQGGISANSPFSAGGVDSRLGSQPEERSPFASPFDRIPADLTLPTRDLSSEFEHLNTMALANRIVFHTFTPDGNAGGQSDASEQTGIRAPESLIMFRQENEKGLVWLAEQTGGAFLTGESLENRLKDTLSRHRYYYVLAYPMPKKNMRKYRKIKLECKRPGITLRTRFGYNPGDMRAVRKPGG